MDIRWFTKLIKLAFLTILVPTLFQGCRKFSSFDPIPVIEYKNHEFFISSPLEIRMLKIEMTFRDGDGDIGLNQEDTLPPFDKASPFYHNLWIELYSLKMGNIEDTFNFNARIQNITPKGQVKSLEGEIQYEIPVDGLADGDSIRIGMQLVDRALNVSVKALSPDIRIQFPQ
ncbi:hypothetical protein AT05_05240 [Schleiferia thermophila str. Yellowstone]|jgi:hypothetical protein|uniref:Lipoprotein n=1 Tax=Schleiferia thermophila TaxID=884107 RepID=A0A369A1U7_9FLAO|nr:hypothetical protein AT05_05240 [Schleiferia thermophila str. Yellowstone]RCX03165.1 hypothetical protein DES35_10344 [Schleiferia thermophila]GCD80293.1 hypothetical protein JCM30197_15400 [Schleiferia thermophila]